MSNKVRLHAASHVQNLRQAYALLLLGIICLLAAWLLHPDTRIYPIGVLVLGIGMLIAAIINPYRLMAASLLITLAGIATFLTFKNLIPGNQAFPALIIALGLGLTGVALMTRRRFIGSAAITPSLLVLVIGILESLLAANLTPHNFVPFMLSLWLPGIGLFVLGLIYLFTAEECRDEEDNHSDLGGTTMQLTRIDRSQARPDASRKGYFDGEVKTLQLVGPNDSNEVELLAVYFSAGARTKPHTHEQDQVLQIIEGQGIVATESEKQLVSAGDVITVPAGIWHWHGATRDTAMCHISIKRPGPSNWEVDEKNWASGYQD